MYSILTTVMPVFLVIVLGFLAGRTRVLGEGAGKFLVDFVFRVTIPVLMLRMLGTASIPEASPFPLWGAFFGSIAIVWAAATVISRWLLRCQPGDDGVLSLASCFGNLILLGIPIALAHYGPDAAAPMAIIFLLEFPVMVLAATIQVELSGQAGARPLATVIRELLAEFVRNPIIIGMLAGIAWRFTDLGFSPAVDKLLALVAGATTPASLFALGINLAAMRVAGELKPVGVVLVLKLVALPAVGWLLATQVFSLPPLWTGVLVLFLAMPSGAVPFVFSMRYGRSVDAVSAAIAIGVPLSALTIAYTLATIPVPGAR